MCKAKTIIDGFFGFYAPFPDAQIKILRTLLEIQTFNAFLAGRTLLTFGGEGGVLIRTSGHDYFHKPTGD